MSTDNTFPNDTPHWEANNWPQLIPMLPARKRFLEIGVGEGRNTIWMVDNMMTDDSDIDCLDIWIDDPDAGNNTARAAEARFDDTIKRAGQTAPHRRVHKHKGAIRQSLATLMASGAQYDFIALSHARLAPDVLAHSCMAFAMLKPRGVMTFADYLWGAPLDILRRPKIAVDAFFNIFAERITPLATAHQAILQKF